MTTATTNTENAITAATTTAAKRGKQKTIRDFVKSYENEIARALPSVMPPERFSRMVLTAITQTPKLSECTPESFIGAMLTAAQLGVEPNTPLGQAYLIPFKNKGVMQCQFQLGYKGMIDLAHRSGEVESIEARVVYENDTFDFEFGLTPKLKHIPAKSDRGKAIWYYAVIILKGGGHLVEIMSREDVDAHARRFSKTFSNGPWQTDFDEMAKKTVLKKALKYAPLKSEFARGFIADEKSNTFDTAEIKIIPEDVVEIDDAGEVVAASE